MKDSDIKTVSEDDKSDSDNTFIKPMDLLGESDEYLKEKGFSDSIVEKARLLRKALCHDKYTEVKLEQDGSISIDVY